MIGFLKYDLRHASRSLRRSPLFSLSIIVTVGLAIGANTAFFSLVDAVLIRPLDFPQPDRLVVIWEEDRLRGTVEEYPSLPDYFDLR